MLETGFLARAASPLAGRSESVHPRATVSPVPRGARFSLRLRAPEGGEGFGLDLAINRARFEGERFAARLGPDEWLIGGADTDGDLIQQETEAALAGRFYALVDVSHRNVAIEISGPGAAEALNAGCALDLSDEAFPAGSATRTLLGKVEIVLLRPSIAPVYRVECWRSFATYAHGFLNEAAQSVAP